MRVFNMSKKCAIEIAYAKCEGNKLVFITSESVCYQTDDYCHENIAYSKLSDLVLHGYIIVEKLYLKQEF